MNQKMDARTKVTVAALAVIGAVALNYGMCRVANNRAEEGRSKSELEQRIKSAPHVLIHYASFPSGRGTVPGPSQIALARNELSAIGAPRHVVSQSTTDIYLRDLLESTRKINPHYRIGESGYVIAADLTCDGTIGGAYAGKKVN